MIFVVLVGIIPLLAGCGFCVCKEKICQPMPVPIIKKELQFSPTPVKAETLPTQAQEAPVQQFPIETPAPIQSLIMPETPAVLPQVKNIRRDLQNEEEFNRTIQNQTIVYYTAGWCTACDKVNPIFYQVAQELEGQYRFITINVDKFRSLATEIYHVTAIPAILFFNNGKEVSSVARLVSSDTTREQLLQTIKMAFEETLQK